MAWSQCAAVTSVWQISLKEKVIFTFSYVILLMTTDSENQSGFLGNILDRSPQIQDLASSLCVGFMSLVEVKMQRPPPPAEPKVLGWELLHVASEEQGSHIVRGHWLTKNRRWSTSDSHDVSLFLCNSISIHRNSNFNLFLKKMNVLSIAI